MRTAVVLVFIAACSRASTSTEASSESPEMTATASASASVVATIAPSSSAPATSASQLDVMDLPDVAQHSKTISFAYFQGNTLVGCYDIFAEVSDTKLAEFESKLPPTGILKEPCEKAFEGRKTFGRCEMDPDAFRKAAKIERNDNALGRLKGATMFVYTASVGDKDMKDCLDLGARWKATPP